MASATINSVNGAGGAVETSVNGHTQGFCETTNGKPNGTADIPAQSNTDSSQPVENSKMNGHANKYTNDSHNATSKTTNGVTVGTNTKTTGASNDATSTDSTASPNVIPLWINGQEVISKTTEPVIAPSTGKEIHRYSSASYDDCMSAIEAASAAFPAWSKTPVQKRRSILLKAADLLDSYKEEHIKAMIDETGEARDFIQEAIDTDLPAEFLRDIAGRIITVTGGQICPGLDERRTAMMVREPYGVCFGMAPWNMPHNLGLRAFLGAIAMGNTVVMKGSEQSPKCHWQLGRVFKEAGLPDGVLNIFITRKNDSADIVKAIIEHPAVKHINFTGSTFVGKIIAGLAGKNLKPCILELGGKAPAIVLDDANIQTAAEEVTVGAFSHSGQICMSTERVIVQKAIAEDFTTALRCELTKYTPKGGRVLASGAGLSKTRSVVSKSLDQGAHLIHGSMDKPSGTGVRMDPVILGGVTKEMDIYYTESFGPSVSLFVVDTEEEAISIANDTEYGLAAAVFSENLGRAMRVAGQIETGAVHINSMSVHDDPCYPHGGVKDSGFGRFNGNLGLEGFTKTKLVSWKV